MKCSFCHDSRQPECWIPSFLDQQGEVCLNHFLLNKQLSFSQKLVTSGLASHIAQLCTEFTNFYLTKAYIGYKKSRDSLSFHLGVLPKG